MHRGQPQLNGQNTIKTQVVANGHPAVPVFQKILIDVQDSSVNPTITHLDGYRS
jgi:hypothetical protein